MFWMLLPLLSVLAVLSFTMALLVLQGFHAKIGFSLPQPVLLELIKMVPRIIGGLLFIGYFFLRQFFP